LACNTPHGSFGRLGMNIIDVQEGFEDTTRWENYVPTPKSKLEKENTQRTMKKDNCLQLKPHTSDIAHAP